jgi:hypothetical protein
MPGRTRWKPSVVRSPVRNSRSRSSASVVSRVAPHASVRPDVLRRRDEHRPRRPRHVRPVLEVHLGGAVGDHPAGQPEDVEVPAEPGLGVRDERRRPVGLALARLGERDPVGPQQRVVDPPHHAGRRVGLPRCAPTQPDHVGGGVRALHTGPPRVAHPVAGQRLGDGLQGRRKERSGGDRHPATPGDRAPVSAPATLTVATGRLGGERGDLPHPAKALPRRAKIANSDSVRLYVPRRFSPTSRYREVPDCLGVPAAVIRIERTRRS